MKRYAFVLLCVIAASGCEPDKTTVYDDQILGDQIIRALDEYRNHAGRYPNDLTELVPEYLPIIAPPRYGERRWDYNRHVDTSTGKDSFGLYIWGAKRYQDGHLHQNPLLLLYSNH